MHPKDVGSDSESILADANAEWVPGAPDEIRLESVPGHVECLLDFLGERDVEAANRSIEKRAGVNQFRLEILHDKVPRVRPLLEFATPTGSGPRALPKESFTDQKFLNLAYEGFLVERVASDLPEKLRESHRARLLDLDGRSPSVLMEWQVAHFFKRRGLKPVWTDRNLEGCEFEISGGPITFEVECTRFSRRVMDRLGDREATSIAWGAAMAARELQLTGHMVVDSHVVSPECGLDDKTATINFFEALKDYKDVVLDIDVPGIGHLSGWLHKLNRHFIWGTREQLDEKVLQKPHDFRSFGCAVPATEGLVGGALALHLRGPRLSSKEHYDYILGTLAEKANKQLTGTKPGIVVCDYETIRDVHLYGHLSELAKALFKKSRHVAALVWRAERNVTLTHLKGDPTTCAFRNSACPFDGATEIPLFDYEAS